MRKFTKEIITFVFALMVFSPFSVLAATEITNEDLENARGGDTSKGITFEIEDTLEIYNFNEGEYKLAENLELGDAFFRISQANVIFDLNEKNISSSVRTNAVIEVDSGVATIKGNGTIDGLTSMLVSCNGTLNIENGTYTRVIASCIKPQNDTSTKLSHLNIQNGTFTDVQMENADVVVEDGTFKQQFLIWGGSSVEINGGTFEDTDIALSTVPMAYPDDSSPYAYDKPVEALVINGGKFTGEIAALKIEGVKNLILTGGTFIASGERAVAAIAILSDDEKSLINALGENCSYDPELESSLYQLNDERTFAITQKEISVINNTPEITIDTKIEFLEGANQTYIIGESDTALFRLSADYSLFETGGKIYVDDKLVDASNYTSASGSTIIKLLKSYMDGLSLGEHVLKVEFNNGITANTKFTVKNAPSKNPNTSDNVLTFMIVFGISSLCLFIIRLYLRKNKTN